ncbi:MAG: ABC transporter ATP-binding protein/permease [Clostridia bacterium]|nr:ABC transporter ATP-binding protein/permease [Clostridia bacterium]
MKGNFNAVNKSNSSILWYFLKGSIFAFTVAIFANIICTLCTTVLPLIISFTVDSVLGTEPVTGAYETAAALFGGVENIKANVWIPAVLIAAIAVINSLFSYANNYLNSAGNQTLIRNMRDNLFSHVQRLPLSRQVMTSTGDVIQRCTSDVWNLSNFISNQMVSLFRIVITMVISVVFMFMMNLILAGVSLALIVIITTVSMLFRVVMQKRFKACDEQEGVLSACAQENLTGVRVVRAFGKERYERDKFEKQNEYYTGLWVKTGKVTAAYWASTEFLNTLQLLIIIVVGTILCIQKSLTSGELIAFISYNALLITPLRELGRIISQMSRAGVALGRICDVMKAPAEELGEYEGEISGDIVFKNVSFGYGEKPVLNNINLTVPKGSVLGIIGETGSGKSTLVSLISRLYEPTDGAIFIGGTDLREIPLATLRANVGLVLQEGYVYSRTVGENIAIAADFASQEDIVSAAQAACLHDNISGFTNGYDTVVGERGVTLSGGQRQRVAIARTLMRKVPIMIFDDSLSAVDSETDAAIRANLKKLFKGATVIIVSHRVSTVMDADNIIVLDGGRIAESGTSAELIEKGGIYAGIYEMQTALPDELKGGAK